MQGQASCFREKSLMYLQNIKNESVLCKVQKVGNDMATVLSSAFCSALHSNDSSLAKLILFCELTKWESLILGVSVADIPMPTTYHFRQTGSLDSPHKRPPTSNSLSSSQSIAAHRSLPSLCGNAVVQIQQTPRFLRESALCD